MKKYFYFAVAIIATLSTGCFATNATTPAAKGAKEISVPMSGPEYRGNNEYWRAVNSGRSDEMAMAKKVAMSNARQELAASVEAEVKSFMENYAQNVGGKAKSIYEELTGVTVKQQLRNIEVLDEKYYQNEDGSYDCYVCLQISKVQVEKELENQIAQEEELKLQFDRERFRKAYEAEFQNYAENR